MSHLDKRWLIFFSKNLEILRGVKNQALLEHAPYDIVRLKHWH
jgi:hypothetical protein